MERFDEPSGAPGRKRIALVIGSGSVKCAAGIGIQSVLEREGSELDMVVGCSAGAIYAAVMAARSRPGGRDDPQAVDQGSGEQAQHARAAADRGAALAAFRQGALLGYTDGVVEAAGTEGAFGESRLLESLRDLQGSSEGLLQRIEAALDAFSEGAEASDDITMVALRRSGSAEGPWAFEVQPGACADRAGSLAVRRSFGL